ncbi:MAG: putative lipid II flippase FtsW [Actinomycetales bacterium]|nr:putative lipid II flippase FtsW [Actinomycetales bacterium]
MSSAVRAVGAPAAPRASVAGSVVRRVFAAETPEYFMLLGTTLFLLVFGLVMVLSSSSVESYLEEGDFFGVATRQGLYALIGLPVMLLAARAPLSFWRRWAWHAIGLGLLLQLLVVATPLGSGNGYNRNWIGIGSFSAQPSELVKLALVVWLARMLTERMHRLDDWRSLLPIAPVAGGAIFLVLLGNDLGTAVILIMIVFGAMFYAGVRLRYLLTAGLAVALAGMLAVVGSDSRRERIGAWLSGCPTVDADPQFCWQPVHGWEALAHGGVLGVGLGNSTAKWSWLPAADNDFIFAIIGEELGMVGTVLVLVLFAVLAISFVRVIRMNRDPFAKIATSVVMVWVIGQAFVNIGVVLGALPVLGVPLPLVSAGGSALLTTMAAIGIVLSFARRRPEPIAPLPPPAPVRRAR